MFYNSLTPLSDFEKLIVGGEYYPSSELYLVAIKVALFNLVTIQISNKITRLFWLFIPKRGGTGSAFRDRLMGH